MRTIDQFNFKDKKALIRVDFNVPLDDQFNITDDNRIVGALPTIRKVLDDGGSAILMSHLGRPKDAYDLKFSLIHLIPHLQSLLGCPVLFAEDCIGEKTLSLAQNLKPGEVLLLENLRFHKEETKGDEKFAAELAGFGDIYVNDAFGTAHRAHASTTIVAQFFPGKKCFGYLMLDEIIHIEKVINNPVKPTTAILGGAKVSDKVLIIENLLGKVDNMLIGGAMAYTFHAAMGGKTGNSLVEKDSYELAARLIEKAAKMKVKFLYTTDSVVADAFNNEAHTSFAPSNEIPDGWMGLDIGPETIKTYKEIILNSKTILWNGPMGVFEMEKFQEGTRSVANFIAEATAKGAFSLIGGGDSVAAIHKFGLEKQVSYISTGGGAMLEYLEGKELPGIKAIND